MSIASFGVIDFENLSERMHQSEQILFSRISIQLNKIHRELKGVTHWSTYLEGKPQNYTSSMQIEQLMTVSEDLQQAAVDIESVSDCDSRRALQAWHDVITDPFCGIWEFHEQLVGLLSS